MKKTVSIILFILFGSASVWGATFEKTKESTGQENTSIEEQTAVFLKNIPDIAKEFIGIPYALGANPQESGSSDNSHLFFAIYNMAAQKAGLVYKSYLTMKALLRNVVEVDENNIQNGDLIVLKNGHAAMIYLVEDTGKIHLIYASAKRQQVLSFNSGNVIFHVYWLENLKGFYRLSNAMLSTAD
ncbi:MAG: C40 family peptidase [Desulfobacteraceae bacterium]|nr:C40 family peptidase [Desulfobacteraceae bacterium]